jgi:hypothetical protein
LQPSAQPNESNPVTPMTSVGIDDLDMPKASITRAAKQAVSSEL